jgi:hypothetical protein
MAQKQLELDGGWMRPIPERQTDLFPQPLDEVLRLAGLTRDDLRAWHQKGWLSFEESQVEKLDTPHFYEMILIRNLVWSLEDESLVNKFLRGLDRPYRYDPARTAFNFAYGWVQTPDRPDAEADQMDKCDFIEKHLDLWIKHKLEIGDSKTLQQAARKLLRASEQPSGRKRRKH